MVDNTTLVSVCVITYNSGKFVLETLNSVFAQTYPRLELIISDDCSTDDTVQRCRSWLQEFGHRFERSEVLVRKANGGVAANLNSAIGMAKGEWLKSIAGDDLLLPDCIKDNMHFVSTHENQGIIVSKVQYFHVINGKNVLLDSFLPWPSRISTFDKSAQEQYHVFLTDNFVPATSLFYKRDLMLRFPFQEQYPLCEDYPQWLRLTKAGFRLTYFDTLTVLYRLSESLSNSGNKRFVNEAYRKSTKAIFYTERLPVLSRINPEITMRVEKEFFLGDIAIFFFNNRRNLFSRALLYIFKLLIGTRSIQ